MSVHYHIATVVKFNPSEKIDVTKPLFSCLYPIDLGESVPHSPVLEEMYLFSTDEGKIPDAEAKFLLADFLYLNTEDKIKRCKVLCPIVGDSLNDDSKISDNFYKILISSWHAWGVMRGLEF